MGKPLSPYTHGERPGEGSAFHDRSVARLRMTMRVKPSTKPSAGIAALGLSSEATARAQVAWAKDWPKTQRTYRACRVPFLKPAAIRSLCRRVKMQPDAAGAIARAAAGIASDPALERIAWHLHWMVFHSGVPQLIPAYSWPLMEERFGEPGRLLYAVAVLSGLPMLERANAGRGIPRRITRETLADVEVWMRDHLASHGSWGFTRQGWLMLHCAGRLLRLGRVQFEPTKFGQNLVVYRHCRSGQARALVGHGARIDADGQFVPPDQKRKPREWKATITRRDQTIRGYWITPRGYVEREAVELDAREWKVALKKGDPMLGVHIPAMGPMNFADCGESFAAALRCFPRWFPRLRFRGFCSASWLFDDQLGDCLPAESNIVRFQREFYLTPLEGTSDFQTWERVFGTKPENPDAAPRDTSLRRAILDHARKGGRWRSGGMFLLCEDLKWGKQVYRSRDAAPRSSI